MKARFRSLVVLSSLLLTISPAFGQGTAFTYQGQLKSGGAPANGSYDFKLLVYDAATGGSVLAGPVTNTAVSVSNGLFTLTVDFGPGVFMGGSNWLHIGVSANGTGAFTSLSPRQQLTPAPYAIFAETGNAAGLSGLIPAGGLSGIYSNAVNFNNPANRYTGNGSGLTNVNAATLGGLGANNFWQTSGNSGTTPGSNFVGTSDNQPLELRVDGQRALRLEVDPRGATAGNIIGGFIGNAVEQPGSGSDLIGGGGYPGIPNTIHSNSSGVFIGAGSANQVGPNVNDAVIAGGFGNTNLGWDAVIAGGTGNTIQQFADHSIIGGGGGNTIVGSSLYSPYDIIAGGYQNAMQTNTALDFIGGGQGNTVQTNSTYAVIGGGLGNMVQANCTLSFIGGGMSNLVDNGAQGATIGGGGFPSFINHISSTLATVSGGSGNVIQAAANDSTIGGGRQNEIDTGAWGASIGGGHSNWIQSASTPGGAPGNSSYATISGGYGNTIQTNANACVIGGGLQNTIGPNATYSTIGGGAGNIIQTNAYSSVIAGGDGNTIKNNSAAIGGGVNNVAGGLYATIPGGLQNTAFGSYSFAAGRFANAALDRSFVWNAFPNTASSFLSDRFHVLGTNGFSVDYYGQRPDGGGTRWVEIGAQFTNTTIYAWNTAYLSDGGAWVPSSDRNRKANFATVDPRDVLERVVTLPIQTWNYTNEPPSVRHLGPVAQDFHTAFGLNGADDKHIADIDEGGVALAAIQGLNQKLEEKEAEIRRLRQHNETLERRLEILEQTIKNNH